MVIPPRRQEKKQLKLKGKKKPLGLILVFMVVLLVMVLIPLNRKKILEPLQQRIHMGTGSPPLLLDGLGAEEGEKKILNDGQNQGVINNPMVYQDAALRSASDMSPFLALKPFNKTTDRETRGWDNEAYDAVTKYFWGRTNGIVLELGALDGRRFSVSADFLALGWHRVLIEASPQYAEVGPQRSPDATFVHGVVCKGGPVHYLYQLRRGAAGAINGIGEFMTPSFIRMMHPVIFNATNGGTNFSAQADWDKWSEEHPSAKVEEIPCISLSSLLGSMGFNHVNFFMLDVEGGELNILQSIDWQSIKFDVLAVETEPKKKRISQALRPENYARDVEDFLSQQGYIFEQNIGRNSWFRHSSFRGSRKPHA